jgi:hypothetical protein
MILLHVVGLCGFVGTLQQRLQIWQKNQAHTPVFGSLGQLSACVLHTSMAA